MKIEIETDGFATGTFVRINGEDYKDITHFCFLVKRNQDKAKLQVYRAVDGGPEAATNLWGFDFARFDEEISHLPRPSGKPGG